MKSRMPILLAVLLAAADAAGASEYEALRREIDDYAPPVLVRPAPPAADQGAAGAPGAGDEAFAAARQRLMQLAEEWRKTLASGESDAAFLRPAADRLRALAPAREDEHAAAAALADGFSLEALETLALLRSPMVATKEREAAAALEVFDQAEQIDVVLRRYASMTGAVMGGAAGMERPADFPFPSVLALKGRIVGEQVRTAREELEAARRDAITMARKAYWELLYNGSAVEVTRGMVGLLESLGDSVTARYEAGETSFQDVVRVRIEREKAREELRTLAEERATMEAEIRGLLALPAEVRVGAPASRVPPADVPEEGPLANLALARRQEVRAADAMVTRMELMLEMAETMTYPGFALGVTASRPPLVATASGGESMDAAPGDPSGMGQAAPAAPARPFLAGDDAYVRELRARIAALQREREAARAAAVVGVRGAWFALDRARREEALYGERVLALSQAAIEASLRGYTAGRVMFSDLLESYTGWLEANLARERARADLGVARAELEAAVGTSMITEQR